MTFLFPNDDAVLFALTSGFVAPEISLSAARTGRDSLGRRWITPRQTAIGDLAARFAEIGIPSLPAEPADGRDIDHWLQAIPLERDLVPPKLADQTPVLFELTDAGSLMQFSTEILRLGNDRQSLRMVEASGGKSIYLLHVAGPPYYSLLRALEQNTSDSPRAFLERAPRVWIEFGWHHPLVQQLAPSRGQLVLVHSPHEWRSMADVAFRDIYESITVAEPERVVRWEGPSKPERIAVKLQLAPTTTSEPGEFWLLRGESIGQVDALVREADRRTLNRLSFATGTLDGEPVAVVRARPHRDGPPQLSLEAELVARSYLRLPNLYLPVGMRLTPPLRRDAVRQLLASEPDRVVWLASVDGGKFAPQFAPEAAFRPLSEWVEHILEMHAKPLGEWMRSARWDFESFVGPEEIVASVRPMRRRDRPRSAPPEVASRVPGATSAKPKSTVSATSPVDDLPAVQPTLAPSELQRQLKSTEERFLSIDGPLDDPRRQAIWPELARLNDRLGHQNDATLCWSNAYWEASQPPLAWAWAWVEAERALPNPELRPGDLERWLGNAQPISSDLRSFAAAIFWASRQKPAPQELRRQLSAIQRYMEQHDRLLPVRVAWLVWTGLIQVAGADVLALARVRDRLLNRLLSDGLSAERDLPGFLRYAGMAKGDRLRTLVERAERLRHILRDWFAQPEVPKGEFDQTPAYIDLAFAFCLARIGESAECRNLARLAAQALDHSEQEVHSFLLQAFQFRIDAAIAGRPHSGPLPNEQLEYLQQLHQDFDSLPNTDQRKFCPYAIERMRKESRILEPQEEFDPYRYSQRFQDAFIAELLRLPDVRDRGELSVRIRKLLQQLSTGHRLFETRLRVLAGTLPLAARVGQSLAEEVLQQIAPALDAVPASDQGPMLLEQKALLLERGMLFAAHFDRSDLVQSFLVRLERMIRADSTEGVLGAVASLIGQSLRSLRKLGLRDESERMLKCVSDAVLKGGSLEELRAREGRNWLGALRLLLNIANGWMYFDAGDRVQLILDEARQYLLRTDKGRLAELPQSDKYAAVVCAYITALGHSSLDEAGGRIEELFTSGRLDPIRNSYTTNTFYSRLHLSIVESVVFALASEDLAFSPAARRWLDDDEYLVRRRIHRDMRAALSAAGM